MATLREVPVRYDLERDLQMPSLIPRQAWARRLVYELIYAWPGGRRATTFNVGVAPAMAIIRDDPAFANDPNQAQLYAELLELAPIDTKGWRESRVLEVAAGCGGGLLYLQKHFCPREAIGIDLSRIAAWRGRRLGVDVRQGNLTRLPFGDQRFDNVVCVEAMNYAPIREFIGEVFRVIKPGGRLFLGECSEFPNDAKDYFHQIASMGGLDLECFRDASQGVRASLKERSPRLSRAIAWLPAYLRDRLKEMMVLEGSDRYHQWQSGASGFAMVILRRPLV